MSKVQVGLIGSQFISSIHYESLRRVAAAEVLWRAGKTQRAMEIATGELSNDAPWIKSLAVILVYLPQKPSSSLRLVPPDRKTDVADY